MKKMILAATAVGAALAGALLYVRKNDAPAKQLRAGTSEPVALVEYRAKHSMG